MSDNKQGHLVYVPPQGTYIAIDTETYNLAAWFDGLELRLSKKENAIAKDILKEIRDRLDFLLQVGLGYLSLVS